MLSTWLAHFEQNAELQKRHVWLFHRTHDSWTYEIEVGDLFWRIKKLLILLHSHQPVLYFIKVTSDLTNKNKYFINVY